MIDEDGTDKVALFDLDGTLINFEDAMLHDLQKLQSPGEPQIDLFREKTPPWLEQRMLLIKRQPRWWSDLPTKACGMRLLAAAQSLGFKIQVLTKGPQKTPNAWGEKLLWCQRHLQMKADITVTTNKGTVYGRVLVDDYPEYMLGWLEHRPRGLGIMPVTRHNQDFEHPQVLKYDGTLVNSEHVVCAMKRAFIRKSGEEIAWKS
jgi:5'-nucleotidase